MKKYFSLFAGIAAFTGFVTYATMQTQPTKTEPSAKPVVLATESVVTSTPATTLPTNNRAESDIPLVAPAAIITTYSPPKKAEEAPTPRYSDEEEEEEDD